MVIPGAYERVTPVVRTAGAPQMLDAVTDSARAASASRSDREEAAARQRCHSEAWPFRLGVVPADVGFAIGVQLGRPPFAYEGPDALEALGTGSRHDPRDVDHAADGA
jgi:hypothetical protein